MRVINCHPPPDKSGAGSLDAALSTSKGSSRLRGPCPESDSSVASLPQNDKRRRGQNDRGDC